MYTEKPNNTVDIDDLLEQEGLVPLYVALNNPGPEDPDEPDGFQPQHWEIVSFDDPICQNGLRGAFEVGYDGFYYGRTKVRTPDGVVRRQTATTTCPLGVYEFRSCLK